MNNNDDPGDLICTVCTNGSPASEPTSESGKDLEDETYVALCTGCKDWGEFMYEKYLQN
jgi:hypothetical protein